MLASYVVLAFGLLVAFECQNWLQLLRSFSRRIAFWER